MEAKITIPTARRFEISQDFQLIQPLLAYLDMESNRYLDTITRCQSNIFVIDDNRGPAALLALSLPYWKDVGMIELLVVKEEYRRQGLATRLYKYAEEVSCSYHLRKLCTQLMADNQAAMNFFLAQGFSFQSVLKDYFGQNRNLYWLDKDLG